MEAMKNEGLKIILRLPTDNPTDTSADETANKRLELFENISASAPDIERDEEGDEEKEDTASGEAQESTGRRGENVLAYNCAVCQKSIRGGENRYRYSHIAVHENIRFPCVVADCQVIELYDSIFRHMSRAHQKSFKTLSADEKQRFEDNCKMYKEEVAPHLSTYFPEGESGFLIDKRKRRGLVNPTCNACGKQVAKGSDRMRHVAKHIGETIKCPMEECRPQKRPRSLACLPQHMQGKHGCTIKSLRGEAKNRYDAAYFVWRTNINSAYSQYFS